MGSMEGHAVDTHRLLVFDAEQLQCTPVQVALALDVVVRNMPTSLLLKRLTGIPKSPVWDRLFPKAVLPAHRTLTPHSLKALLQTCLTKAMGAGQKYGFLENLLTDWTGEVLH